MNGSEHDPHAAAAPGSHPQQEEGLVEELDTAECWRLLEHAELGRLAVEGIDGVPDVFPVNHIVHSGSVYLRSAPGSKLMDIAARPAAAFEVDGESVAFRWSIVLRGTAQRLDTDADIEESGILALATWSPTSKNDFIRLTPSTITGRRFRRRAPDTPLHNTASVRALGDDADSGSDAARKPIPIPHFGPFPEA